MKHSQRNILIPADQYDRLVQQQQQQSTSSHTNSSYTQDNDEEPHDNQIKDKWQDEILNALQGKKAQNAVQLLHILPIKWDEDGTIVSFSGHLLPDSNIKDFIVYTQVPGSKRPKGLFDLYTLLMESGIPVTLLDSKKVRDKVKYMQEFFMDEDSESDAGLHPGESQANASPGSMPPSPMQEIYVEAKPSQEVATASSDNGEKPRKRAKKTWHRI